VESHSSQLTSLLGSGRLVQIGSQLQRLQLAQQGSPHSLPGYDWGLLVALIVTLLLAAAASAAETALTSVRHIKIRTMAEEGDQTAQRILRIIQHPDVFLSTILIVSNVAVITASTLATLIAVSLDFSFAEAISTALLSIIVLIFCEVTPKTAAVQNPEAWARWVIRPVEALSYVLRPAVLALNAITRGILRLFGVEARRRVPFVTEEELRMLVEVGEEEGVLEGDERTMIRNVFDLADTAVREIMIPRVDMVTVEVNDSVDDATRLILQGGQSRIPVYDAEGADIVGVLYAKDLLRVLASQEDETHRPHVVSDLPLRAPYFVPESKRLDDLLHEMQRQHVHIAMVVDEYGAVAGLVTIEDVVEEIIGDIKDEYDKEEQIFEQVGPNEFIIDAKISLDDLNELLETEFTSEDYDTLGGLVYAKLDKIPGVGDTVTANGLTLTVLGTRGRRITKVKVVRADSQAPSSEREVPDARANDSSASPSAVIAVAPAETNPPQPIEGGMRDRQPEQAEQSERRSEQPAALVAGRRDTRDDTSAHTLNGNGRGNGRNHAAPAVSAAPSPATRRDGRPTGSRQPTLRKKRN